MSGAVVWLTGLPSSGKSTLAERTAAALRAAGHGCCVLDGDEVRSSLVPAPGYDDAARDDFYETLARLAAMLARQGLVVLVPATAHRRRYRRRARELAPRMVEVHVTTDAATCAERDAKGLYAKAAAGELDAGVPGAGAAYEPPQDPEVSAEGGRDDEAVERIVARMAPSRPGGRIEHIVTATDFSDASLPALQVAERWARAWNASVSLVHAYDPLPLGPAVAYSGSDGAVAATIEELAKVSSAQLERVAEGRFEGLEVQRETMGRPAAWLAICDHAEARRAHLIVLGTHGRTGVERLLIGSTAERVARHAPCPVLVVRGAELDDGFPRHVLVATDFSEESQVALEPARALALRHGSKLTVGHVYDNSPIMLGGHQAFTDTAVVDAELRDKLRATMDRELAGVADLDMALLAAPNPVVGLCDYARNADVDLIVVATRGRSGVSRLVMGSVAERIVRHAPCSVLVVRRG